MTRKMTKKDVLATNMTVIQLLNGECANLLSYVPPYDIRKESMVSMPMSMTFGVLQWLRETDRLVAVLMLPF